MKRTAMRIIFGSLALVVAASAATLYVVHRKSIHAQEQSIDIKYSDLVANPDIYVGKRVRVQALMFEGPLSDPRWMDEDVRNLDLGYDFAPDAKEASAKYLEVFKPDVPDIPHQMTVCRRALVTMVGDFAKDGARVKTIRSGSHLQFAYWVIIRRIEKIEDCPKLWFHDRY